MPELRNNPLQAFLAYTSIFNDDPCGKFIGENELKLMVSNFALANCPVAPVETLSFSPDVISIVPLYISAFKSSFTPISVIFFIPTQTCAGFTVVSCLGIEVGVGVVVVVGVGVRVGLGAAVGVGVFVGCGVGVLVGVGVMVGVGISVGVGVFVGIGTIPKFSVVFAVRLMEIGFVVVDL